MRAKPQKAWMSTTGAAHEWLAAMCSHIPNRGESRRWRECGAMAITGMPAEATGKKKKLMLQHPVALNQMARRRQNAKHGRG